MKKPWSIPQLVCVLFVLLLLTAANSCSLIRRPVVFRFDSAAEPLPSRQNSEPDSRSPMTLERLLDFDRSMYLPVFRDGLEGELIGRYSPVEFKLYLVQITGISEPLADKRMIIPLHDDGSPDEPVSEFPLVDVLSSGNLVSVAGIPPSRIVDFWVQVQFFNAYAKNPEDDKAVIAIDLGEAYRNVDLPQAINRIGSIHYFSPLSLNPLYAETGSTSNQPSLLFTPYVEKSYYFNPDNEFLPEGQNNAHFWTTSEYVGKLSYEDILYVPGETIEIPPIADPPEIICRVNTENLIELYDNRTPGDPGDDILVFRLDNPFPWEIFALD